MENGLLYATRGNEDANELKCMKMIGAKPLFVICVVVTCNILSFYDTLKMSTIFKPLTTFYKGSKAQFEQLQTAYFKAGNPHKTNECVIPLTPIMPKSLEKKWRSTPGCQRSTRMTTLENEKTLVLDPDFNESTCCVRELTRYGTDNDYRFKSCRRFTDRRLELKGAEVVQIQCGHYTNYEVAIPTKSKVREKLQFWKARKKDAGKSKGTEKPISVLIFGFDSSSRAQIFRSLPNSVNFMLRNLSFVDFNQYHSIGPSTLTNFMGFLMGKTRPEVRNGCAPKWSSQLDNCSFIWRGFSKQNYLTNYLEDGHGSFRWNRQGGFKNVPTDFYIHRLFKLLTMEQNLQNLNRTKYEKFPCTSRECLPKLLLDYTFRFSKKFRSVPFFSFTWFDHPFHQDFYFLNSMDEMFLNFLKDLENLKGFLERTVIIMLGDHGDRISFFGGSTESYIERLAPPLFIRLPELLIKKYPEIKMALDSNSQKFTTPFDVHHTLRHILSLISPPKFKYNLQFYSIKQGKTKSKSVFPVHLKDRSSLLVKFPEDRIRNCSTGNIPQANCLCNLHYDRDESHGKDRLKIAWDSKAAKTLLKYSTWKLNKIIRDSEYGSVCKKWTTDPNGTLYAHVITATEKFTEILLAFQTKEKESRFEARIKVRGSVKDPDFQSKLHGENGTGHFSLVGFGRINKYGNQSWCVKTATDFDKYMKELCMCKGTKKHFKKFKKKKWNRKSKKTKNPFY